MAMLWAVAFVLAAFLTSIEVTSAIRWTSSNRLPDNTTVTACEGENVTLDWRFGFQQAEHLSEEEWHFVAGGSHNDTTLAVRLHGQFVPEPGTNLQFEFIPNAGVHLINVSRRNTGTYSVRVNLNVHGSIQTHVQRAHVQVSSALDSSDVLQHGHLEATMQPGAWWSNTSNSYHVLLACSKIKTQWQDNAHIVWTTPDSKALPTSWYSHGVAYLSVPNPVTAGNYTCRIDNSSADWSCLAANSPLLRGATVRVDGMEARLSLMEGRLQGMANRENSLASQVHALQAENQALKQELDGRCGAVVAESHTRPAIAFDVSLQTLTTSLQPLAFTDVTTNQGGAFKIGLNKFIVPVNGTYVFHLTLVSQNSEVDEARVTVHVVVDGVRQVAARTSKVTGYYNTGSVDLVKVLHSGQRVWVTNETDGQRHFSFSVHLSGVLISAGV